MRTYAAFGIIVGIASLAAACQRHDEAGTPIADQTPAKGSGAAEAVVKTESGLALKEIGVEPRRELRYHVPKGNARSLQLSIDIDMDVPGQASGPIPTMRMIGDLAFGDAKPDGAMPMTMTVHDIHLADRPGAPPTAALVQQRLGVLEGFTLHGDLSPLGAMSNVTTDAKNVPADLRGQLDSMTQNLQQIALPLPAEAVGVGASWELAKSTEQGAMKLTTVTHFTVTKLDGDAVGFHTVVEVHAPKQKLPGEGDVEIESVTGGGSGDGSVDLRTFAISGSSKNGFRAEMSAGGQHASIGTTMAITMSPAN